MLDHRLIAVLEKIILYYTTLAPSQSALHKAPWISIYLEVRPQPPPTHSCNIAAGIDEPQRQYAWTRHGWLVEQRLVVCLGYASQLRLDL